MKLINVLSEKFVKTLDDHPYHRNLKTFDKDHWFGGVWKTIVQSYMTKGGMKNLINDKGKIQDDLFSMIEDFPIDKSKVDDWYESSIKYLKNNYPGLTIGTSQKLINMLIKYILTSHYSRHTDEKLSFNLRKNLELIHIPIDVEVLKNCRKKFEEFKKFIHVQNKLGFGNNLSSWSNLESYSDYEKFQNKIRVKRKELRYNSSLEFEMKELWLPEKK